MKYYYFNVVNDTLKNVVELVCGNYVIMSRNNNKTVIAYILCVHTDKHRQIGLHSQGNDLSNMHRADH